MKKKNRWVFLLLLLCSHAVSAETEQELKQRIVDIKLNGSYLWGESTDKTEEAARESAEGSLLTQVKSWLISKGKDLELAQQASAKWTAITTNRGNQKRVFLYVKASDIASGGNTVAVTTPTVTSTTTPVASTATPVASTATPVAVPSVIQEIAACAKYADMATKVQTMKADGRLKSYARYASLTHPEDCYLIIYNREGDVVATLTPGTTRKNVATGEETSLSRYKGCGAIGVEVSK